jgi:hypothetical protein
VRPALLALALLLACAPGPPSAEDRAAQTCDLETLQRERGRLRDELGRALWEPEAQAEILQEMGRLDAAVRWCGRRT